MLITSTTTILVAALLIVQTIDQQYAMATTIPGAFIVEYADGGTDSIAQQHSRLLTSLGPLSQLLQVRQTYSSPLFRGVAINLQDNNDNNNNESSNIVDTVVNKVTTGRQPVLLEQLIRSPDVLNIYPIMQVPRPQWIEEEDQAHLPYENKLSQLKDIHRSLNITGSGITVGILDSGVDYNHPALGGGFGNGFKVRLGYNLVDPDKDDQDAGTHRAPNDPYDVCLGNEGGHGTHVSGIIAGVDASKSFLGVAPDVTLGMWRIFGCSGGASEDIVIKAMEMAYAAGCNVINLSLGTQTAWAENAMAVVADRLAKNGVIVVSVAGNQGSDGVFMQNSPGSGPQVISVASVDNSFYLTLVATADAFPDETYPYELSTSTKQMPNGTLTVIIDQQTQDIITACSLDAIPSTSSLNSTILLVRRGECNYADKLQVAEQAGAKAVLFYDSQSPDTNRAIQALTDENAIPSAGIPKQFADKLIEAASNKTLNISFSIHEYNQTLPSAGQISSFSSVGPTYELDLKPTLAGIGNQVFSTVPLRMSSGWGTRSGTSMAAPHISGVAALMLEYYKQKNVAAMSVPAFVTEQLQNHAQIATFEDLPDHPLLQGAGLVQPFTSLQSGIHVSPGRISFNDTANIVKTHQLHIANDGIEPITANLQHSPSKAILPYTNTTSFTLAQPHQRDDTHVELEFVPSRITLKPGQSVDIQVTIRLPSIDYHYQMYGGFIQFVEADNGDKNKLASVPYFGLLGSVNELPLFDHDFPYLAPGGNPDIMYGPTDTFVLNTTNAQYPDIICRMLSPTARVSIQVVVAGDNQGNNKVIGDIDGGPFQYWERNRLAESDYYRAIQWNGKIVTNGVGSETILVSQGTYRLRLRALKMFGNPDIPEQWEEWISGPILVQ